MAKKKTRGTILSTEKGARKILNKINKTQPRKKKAKPKKGK